MTSPTITVLCNNAPFASQFRQLFYRLLSVTEVKYVVDLRAVFLADLDRWQDLLLPWVQRFPVSVWDGGLRANCCRVADRSKYFSSFDIHCG